MARKITVWLYKLMEQYHSNPYQAILCDFVRVVTMISMVNCYFDEINETASPGGMLPVYKEII